MLLPEEIHTPADLKKAAVYLIAARRREQSLGEVGLQKKRDGLELIYVEKSVEESSMDRGTKPLDERGILSDLAEAESIQEIKSLGPDTASFRIFSLHSNTNR